MGQKSQARREKKAAAKKAAQWGEVDPSRNHLISHVYAEPYLPDAETSRAVSQMFRRSCSDCRSDDLVWMTPAELAEQGDDERRARVAEGLEYLGEATEAWLCRDCDAWGLM